MRIASRIATVVFVLALPIAIVTTNIRILLSEENFYERGFRKYDAEVATGIPLEELDRAGSEIIDYFFNDEETLNITVVEGGQRVPLFNERERRHMADVKDLVGLTLVANEIALVYVGTYVVTAVIWSRERSVRGLAWRSLAGVGAGVLAGGAVAAGAVVGGFDAAWTRFHEIFFPQGFWQFDASRDHLIQMFPEPFWAEASMFVLAMSAAEAAVLLIAASAYLLFVRPRRAEPALSGPDADVSVQEPGPGVGTGATHEAS